MRKKITLLMMAVTLLWMGTGGKLWGQVGGTNGYWGDGWICDGGSYSIGVNDHNGINIDGFRYYWWFLGVSPGSTSPPTGWSGTSFTNTSSSMASGTYWNGTYWYYYYYTTTNSSYCSGGTGGTPGACTGSGGTWITQYTHTIHTSIIYYPVTAPNNDYTTTTPMRANGPFSAPSHSHGRINVTLENGGIYTPIHYAHLAYKDPEWAHYTYTFSTSTGTWGTQTQVNRQYVSAARIIVDAGASIRLHDATAITAVGSQLTTHEIELPASYFMRFDQVFTGLNGVTYVTGSSTLTEINNANKGLGFFNGIQNVADAVTLRNGYLFLGSSTTNQRYTVNASAPVFIENYYRLADLADNSVNVHDVAINFDAFTLAGNPLYISNSNDCREIIFYTTFTPAGVSSSTGGVHIGVFGAGTGGTRGGGITRFNGHVTFGNSTTPVTGPVRIYGGDVIFEGTSNYAYNGSAEFHNIWAHGECSVGDILFQGGTVAVTKSGGNTEWTAYRNIQTSVGSTVTYNISGASATTWRAGTNILTNDDVTFTLSTSGLTTWIAGTNITSTTCSDFITFTHTGTGQTLWEATSGSINLQPEISFSKTNNNNGFTQWKAGLNINTHNNVTFTSNGNSTLYTINPPKGTKWDAGQDIIVDQTCGTGKIVEFTNNSTTDDYMWWLAGRNINVNGTDDGNRITVNFTNNATNASTDNNYMLWDAVDDINVTRGIINFVTNGSGTATGRTEWLAGNDILIHQYSPASFLEGLVAGHLLLDAGRDLRTGIVSPLSIEHLSPASITMRAGRNIWSESAVDIMNRGVGNETLLDARQDIRIDSTLTFTATNPLGIEWVRLWARDGDIIVNTQPADITNPDANGFHANTVCDGFRAAVNFTLAGANSTTHAGSTLWRAGNNIISNDTISFHYANTGNKVAELQLQADLGNIDLRRIINIDYDSPNLIRWEALTGNDLSRRENKYTLTANAALTCYNGTQNANINVYGNIRTSDSVIINRTYSGVTQGRTEFDAYNDIQTAMFNFTSPNTAGDHTSFTSRMGDIWLGYSHTNPAPCTANNIQSPVGFDLNRFVYNIPVVTSGGLLSFKAGFDDSGADQFGGGNIYFTHIVDSLAKGGTYDTEITIPFSNMFTCSTDKALWGCDYERAGIIGGVWRCQSTVTTPHLLCTDTGLIHIGNKGNLLVDAGSKGNIIVNNGVYLNFQDDGGASEGNSRFLTQKGDIDMRNPFNAERMQGSLLFYANSLQPDKLEFDPCGCDERMNNIYLQDFQYTPVPSAVGNSGSVFIGADNNIKLQYGGLKTIGTQFDPFYNESPYQCNTTNRHCDSDTSVNRARPLILDFEDTNSGGFAAVASDLIDVYKRMHFYGGTGSGMETVPGIGTLHGENVTGYGLFIKSQGNKRNWTKNPFYLAEVCEPTCPGGCEDAYLHHVARVTFHDDARIYTQNTRSYIGGPVVESYGNFELNTIIDPGTKTSLRIQTDSLIVHDSLIIDGPKTQFSTWSALERNMPVFKFGHQRFTPPFTEDGTYCAPCVVHDQGVQGLDTIVVTFRNDAFVDRLHTLIADHTVLTFLTDTFDHSRGNPTLDAKFYTDIFKIRNQVELWGNPSRTQSGHFELVSEAQMHSKDYSGIFARQLHMEPIAPECKTSDRYSDLWILDPALDVISSTKFGGFGTLHADVHVETQAIIAPGYASLGVSGSCYEQMSGTLKMKDLRLDKGAELHFSIGDKKGFDDWETDMIEVDDLMLHGTVNVFVDVRCNQKYEPGCYPIILYKTVGVQNLNHLLLGTLKLGQYQLSLDFETTPGVVYLCVGDAPLPIIQREVIIPEPPTGVSVYPLPGVHYVPWGHSFTFTLSFAGPQYLIQTSRLIDTGGQETLRGIVTANGEYEYTIPFVKTQPLYVYIGPTTYVANELIDKDALVWSHGNTLYINVEQKDVASIFSVTGMLVKRIEVPDGGTSLPMQRGVFIVTLKDGSVHKVIIN